MKQGTKTVLLILCLFAVLVAVNFFFYAGNKQTGESEYNADRSSYSSTPFGILAYYTLLDEKGIKVTRLLAPYGTLKDNSNIGTMFLVQIPPGSNPSEQELKDLMEWVERGGLLIIVDRQIELPALPGGGKVETSYAEISSPVKPLQPTRYTEGINRLEVSAFATHVSIEGRPATADLGDNQGTVVADCACGRGRIIFITDPHIIANNGLLEADNLMLADNILRDRPAGTIAFDEYHHGYGQSGLLNRGGVLGYFRGTPVGWMMLQALFLAALVIYTKGRRFGRPVPLRRERRTTNLEFVSSMATITRLARATSLAMGNIYGEFRRRLCKYAGLPSKVDSKVLAAAVARRGRLPESESAIWRLLLTCEQISRGRVASDNEMLELVSRIREIESRLKI